VLAATFREKTRAEWCALLEGTDACVAPVLSLSEAPGPRPQCGARHLRERRRRDPARPRAALFGDAIRRSRTAGSGGREHRGGARDWGVAPDRIQALLASGAVGARALSDKV
jgi:alpha-methylacyl-CoA racemase